MRTVLHELRLTLNRALPIDGGGSENRLTEGCSAGRVVRDVLEDHASTLNAAT
jgi:hypothetical protein